MRGVLRLLFVTLVFGICLKQPFFEAKAASPTLAFPGVEGYGKYSQGGRGGAVCKVTNLNNSGAGSLRNCIIASGPRIVVFDIGGTISLTSDLDIYNKVCRYLTPVRRVVNAVG